MALSKKENHAVIMDENTRKRFLSAWQKRKQEEIIIHFLRKNTFRTRSICSSSITGEVSSRGFGGLSTFYMEMRCSI